MNAASTPLQDADDMPAEIDFSGAVRGKFNLPVYLDADIQAYLANIAAKQY